MIQQLIINVCIKSRTKAVCILGQAAFSRSAVNSMNCCSDILADSLRYSLLYKNIVIADVREKCFL